MVDRGENFRLLAAEPFGSAVLLVTLDVFDFPATGKGQHGTGIVAVAGTDMTGDLIIIL